MQIFLETERLVLRRFTEDDVDDLVELDSDPDVMHFINGGRPTPRREIESDVLPMFLDYYERFVGYGFWAAMEKSSGRFVGWFHFRPATVDRPDEVELGYRLRKSFWGKGYATEGSRALIDKGFAELGVQRVVAFTMVVQRRVATRDGEGRPAPREDVSPAVARLHRGRRRRRRRIRAAQIGMEGADRGGR